jgi:hypothetical protein
MSDGEELSDETRAEFLKRCNQLEEEIANNGGSTETRVRLANVHLKLGEREEAIMSLQSALELSPGMWKPTIVSRLRQICTEEEFANLELPEEAEPFWHDIPGLLKYPLSGAGIYLLIGGTVFVSVLQFLISLPTVFFYGSILLSVFLSGYLSAYFVSIVRSSARGRMTPPDWPDIGINIARPLFIVSFPGTVSFLPALIYLFYWIFAHGPVSILIGLIAAGALYYPMALIASIMTGAAMNSANFVGVISSILKVRKEYFIAIVTLAFFAGISTVAHFMVAAVTSGLAGAIIAGFAIRFLDLYFLMVYAHVLGLLYRQCEDRIGL